MTLGAAAMRIPQSVASRRIMSLEEHLGAPLLDRTSRQATLTPFGRSILPSAKRLVDSAEAFEVDAARSKASPLRLAVPEVCTVFDLARLVHAARRDGILLETRALPPADRRQRVAARDGWAALVAVPETEAVWRVALGVASSVRPVADTVFLDTLRPGHRFAPAESRHEPASSDSADTDTQAAVTGRRLWLQPEDATPHVQDRVARLADSLGLAPAQVATGSLMTGAAAVLGSHDLLLCSERQADELDLHWRPIGEIELTRGYDLRAESAADATRLRNLLHDEIGRCLGAAA